MQKANGPTEMRWRLPAGLAAESPLLVDMESYGIGSLARSLGWFDNVAVLRVATDALAEPRDLG